MRQHRAVRIIKQARRDRQTGTAPPQARGAGHAEPSERELRTVVSGWISEHRQRTEELRRALVLSFRPA